MKNRNGEQQFRVAGVSVLIGTGLLIGWLSASSSAMQIGSIIPEKKDPNTGRQPKVGGRDTTLPMAKTEVPPMLTAPADSVVVKRIQQRWAEHLKVPVVIEEDLGGGVKLKMVLIPPGKFRMGSTDDAILSAADEKPSREVTISKPFYLGMYEVTRGEFRKFVDATQYRTNAEDGTGSFAWNPDKREFFPKDEKLNWKVAGFDQTDSHPVVNESWDDAQAFCVWLTKRESTVRKVRKLVLPTEAEWEYACRAGTTTLFVFGDDADQVTKYANTELKDEFRYTAAVGQYPANPFGLFDMHGNALEWCEDWFGPYAGLGTKDPVQREKQTTDKRAVRGGGWINDANNCRSAVRNGGEPDNRGNHIGFRVCFRIE